MGNRVGSSPTDRMQANGKEEKGCRIGKQGFEAAVLSGGIPFRCQALRRSNSWDLSELNYARQQTGRCLQKEEYHGGDFRLQMAEKGCAQIVMKSDSKKANASNGSLVWSLRCRKTCIRSDANISLTKRYIDRVLTKYKKVL